MGLMLHSKDLSAAPGASISVDPPDSVSDPAAVCAPVDAPGVATVLPSPRAGQETRLSGAGLRPEPPVTGRDRAPEGIAYRGLAYGLLLALPFWIMIVALVMALR